jgi:hypothetical protein
MTWLSSFPTERLVALRDLLKYSDAEPRDERGRWTSGGSFDQSTLVSALRHVVGVDALDDGDSGARSSIRAGNPNSEALTILGAIASAPPTAPPLFRGLILSSSVFRAEFFRDTVDLNVSSWSTSRGVANDYAYAGEYGDGGHQPVHIPGISDGPDNVSVVLSLAPGGQALDVYGTLKESATGALPNEQEWLTAGRFSVNSVAWEPDTKVYRVDLNQVATLEAPQLVRTR